MATPAQTARIPRPFGVCNRGAFSSRWGTGIARSRGNSLAVVLGESLSPRVGPLAFLLLTLPALNFESFLFLALTLFCIKALFFLTLVFSPRDLQSLFYCAYKRL
jgi:hypothetical protein